MALVLDAPAKVNLYLRVLGRRRDGYHEIRTLFQALELADTVTAERSEAPGVQFSMRSEVEIGLPVAVDRDNLVCRAARAFLAATGIDPGRLVYRLRLYHLKPFPFL